MSTTVTDRHDAFPGTSDTVRPGLLPRLGAEAFGSLFIAVAGLGVPLFSIPQSSPLPAALAAGLAVTAAMLAVGHVSGGHFNPAITLGHLLAGRIRAGVAAAYAVAQVAGAVVGALVLFAVLRTLPGIADSRTAFDTVTAGFGEHSIIQAPVAAVLLLEVLGAAIVVAVFLGAAARERAGAVIAPFAVGLTFAALLQLGQAMGNLPYNPARALASAVFSSGWAVEQLWVFLVAPLAGAAVAGLLFRIFRAAPAPVSAPAAGDTSDDDASLEGHPEGAAGAGTDGAAGSAGATRSAGQPERAAESAGGAPSEAQEFFDGKRS
ncbi:major intrinsic protein [Pseudarthrobacter chlorophenolicus A6]|uniref:Major intrinsic protein n=1 Tax=Pseudarthrobacter chlorophenolicus (strain ATCC 700700 / DSM 12829 / CIP 107037 / JCM 12360 / KCTC 9906 / NCIMB 13794 / A6) TaxID=452863 RepID=B8HAV8_PSECP|nr:aquaporin [Pseudarthrobacter chlorophenolicus]ACL40272.1 major intrinsic protein [Pseudarthrobacter chlorophenolicus A6]SDQ84574.1 aquaporin Z [Pseudarthrobacter chlorophenolicus]